MSLVQTNLFFQIVTDSNQSSFSTGIYRWTVAVLGTRDTGRGMQIGLCTGAAELQKPLGSSDLAGAICQETGEAATIEGPKSNQSSKTP